MKTPRSLLVNGDGGAEILGGGRKRSAISRCIALFAPVGVVFQVVLYEYCILDEQRVYRRPARNP